MAISKVRTSAGTTLSISAGTVANYAAADLAALTYTQVGEISDIGSFGKKYNLVTFTPLADRKTVKRKGSYNNGTLSLKMGSAPTDAGQILMQAGSNSDASYAFKVTTQAGNSFYFTGQVMSFVLEVGSVDQIMGASAEIEIDNDILTQASDGSQTVVTPPVMVASYQQAAKMRPNDGYNILTGTSGSSALRTSYQKWEFDGPFDIAQVVISSKVSSGAQGNFKAQVAVTDEISNSTISKAFVPQRAGVAQNFVGETGWKDVTFGGAATAYLQLAPVTLNNNVSVSMTSDPVALTSVARADGKPGGILLVKIVQIDPLGQLTQEGGSNSVYDTARGAKPWFREAFVAARAGVDGIATLTALPTAVTEASTGYTINSFPIVTTTASAKPIELVMFTGDSRKAAAYSSYHFNNPNRQALMELSTPDRPISVVDAAGSGHDQSMYLQVALDLLTNGLRPTVIYLPGFSQNGFTGFTAFKSKNDAFMASVRAISGLANVKFVIDTDHFVQGYAGTANETARQQCIAYAKSLVDNVKVFLFDSDVIMTDYTTTPGTPVNRSAYMNADGIHANQAGQDLWTYGDGTNIGLKAVYKTVLGIP